MFSMLSQAPLRSRTSVRSKGHISTEDTTPVARTGSSTMPGGNTSDGVFSFFLCFLGWVFVSWGLVLVRKSHKKTHVEWKKYNFEGLLNKKRRGLRVSSWKNCIVSIQVFFSFSLFCLAPFFAGGWWVEYGLWDEDDRNYNSYNYYRTGGFNQVEGKTVNHL